MRKLSVMIFLFLFVLACSHIRGSYYNVDGQAYDPEKMDLVQTGMTVEEVEALVGAPLEITREEGKVFHRYFMVRERIDKDKGLGVFSIEKKTTETYEVTLTYEDGIVIRKSVSSIVDKPGEKEQEKGR